MTGRAGNNIWEYLRGTKTRKRLKTLVGLTSFEHLCSAGRNSTGRPATTAIPNDPSPNYLRETLVKDLEVGDARFDFEVQPRTSPNSPATWLWVT